MKYLVPNVGPRDLTTLELTEYIRMLDTLLLDICDQVRALLPGWVPHETDEQEDIELHSMHTPGTGKFSKYWGSYFAHSTYSNGYSKSDQHIIGEEYLLCHIDNEPVWTRLLRVLPLHELQMLDALGDLPVLVPPEVLDDS